MQYNDGINGEWNRPCVLDDSANLVRINRRCWSQLEMILRRRRRENHMSASARWGRFLISSAMSVQARMTFRSKANFRRETVRNEWDRNIIIRAIEANKLKMRHQKCSRWDAAMIDGDAYQRLHLRLCHLHCKKQRGAIVLAFVQPPSVNADERTSWIFASEWETLSKLPTLAYNEIAVAWKHHHWCKVPQQVANNQRALANVETNKANI